MSIPTTSGVYIIRNQVTGGFYVGSAKNLQVRWHTHTAKLRAGTHHNPKLQASWNRHGAEAFVFEVLRRVPLERLLLTEQKAMNRHGVGRNPLCYNLRAVAESNRNYKHTPEARARMSEAQRLVQTPERRATSGANLTAYNRSRAGRPLTQEHRERISAATKGRKPSPVKRGSDSPASLLTHEQVSELMAAPPKTLDECAAWGERFGVSKYTIRNRVQQERRRANQ